MRLKKLLASVFAVIFLSSSFPLFAAADQKDSDSIEIKNIDEFLDFAESCTLDGFSSGKNFVLKSNISLSGTSFSPIQNFLGTFDGSGHTIDGLSFSGDGSRQGLFRRVGKGGEIKNLNVKGNVTPSGSRTLVGGIVGENAGTLTNCFFSGKVEGLKSIGGIAGSNLSTGIISSCRFKGTASGEHEVGGIVGSNSGMVVSCRNSGEVCAWPIAVVKQEEFSIATFDISQVTTEDFVNISNLGGVAGISTGTIRSCTNKGTVGYPYQGFNIGGIAGENAAGYIDGCENHGDIFGQTDVGGIAGQLEPYTSIELTQDIISQLQGQSDQLNNEMNLMASSIGETMGTNAEKTRDFLGNTSAITEEIDKLKEKVDNSNPEDVINSFDIGKLTGDLSSLYTKSEEMLSVMEGTASQFSSGIGSIMQQVNGMIGTINSAMQNLSSGRKEITEDISVSEAYNINAGAVSKCTNSGDISADNNAGGITGIASIEISFDAADKLQISEHLFSNSKTKLFAVVRDCSSSGNVNVRDSYAGGVSGNMMLGAVVNCTSSSKLNAEQGDYVGGIAGISKGSIIKCSSRSSLSGEMYIGGIAGIGTNISDCISYASIKNGKEYIGSVAGYSEGEISGNRYVDLGLGAIDGASYAEKAYPVSYDEMAEIEGIPEFFLPIRVSFIVNNTVFAVRDVEFGGSVKDIPSVPDNDSGQHWVWNDFCNENIFTGFDVSGYYPDSVPTLATKGKEPDFLVEGVFNSNNTLKEDAYSANLALIGVSEESVLKSATLTVTDFSGNVTVHMRAEGGGNLFVTDKEGALIRTSYKTDGSYLVFNMDNGASIVYVSGNNKIINYYFIYAAAALIVAVFAVVILKNKYFANAKEIISSEKTAQTESGQK